MAVFDAQVDMLYFNARETGVSYAIVNEQVVNPNFNQRFGFRAKIGVQAGEDCWEVGLQFLHYHARGKSEVKGEVFPTWGHPLIAIDFNEASDLWRLHLGFLDALLSRNWWVSPSLELTPQMSLRYGEIRHKLRVSYDEEEDLCFKNKYWCGGPGIGLEGLWHLFDCIGIYSRGVFHLVYGKFYVHQNIDLIKLFNEFWQTKGMFEGALGLDFRWCQLTARIGWELHLLLGQNQLMRFVDDVMPGKFVTNLGDLSMQGLTFGLNLEF